MPSSVQGASVSPGLRRTVPACAGLPPGIAVLGTCPRAEHAFAVLLPSWRWDGFCLCPCKPGGSLPGGPDDFLSWSVHSSEEQNLNPHSLFLPKRGVGEVGRSVLPDVELACCGFFRPLPTSGHRDVPWWLVSHPARETETSNFQLTPRGPS